MTGQDGMNCGNIVYAFHEGTWVLRLRGDVRAPWCASMDALIEQAFADPSLRSIVIDLHEATNIDSTMLGLLAKIAIQSRNRLAAPPLLLAPNDDIRRLLDSMCLQQVFRIADSEAEHICECAELALVDRPESDLCRQIADAHQVLMDIDERNRAAFNEVVATLESRQRASTGS